MFLGFSFCTLEKKFVVTFVPCTNKKYMKVNSGIEFGISIQSVRSVGSRRNLLSC